MRSHIESRPAPTDEVHHPALVEILQNLQGQKLNNPRIPIMIKGYFEDMNLVFRQLARICRPNARLALVVANARFHGELIPVDLILSELAGDAGFQTERIYVTRYKGNSSQQMGKFGRVAVRESVALWQFVGHPTRPEPRQKVQHQPPYSSRKAIVKQLAMFETKGMYKAEGEPMLSDFASTKEEIFRAVRKNSIQRGVFAIQTLIAIRFGSLIDEVQQLLRHLHSIGTLESVTYKLKGTVIQDEDRVPPQEEVSLSVAQLTPEELEERITEFEKGRVVYK